MANRASAPSGMQIRGARRTAVDLDISLDQNASPEGVIQQVLDLYNRSTTALAIFRLNRSGKHFQIVPEQVHNYQGIFVKSAALLDAATTLPAVTQSLYSTLKAFCEELSRATGKRVHLGTIPINYAAQNDVTFFPGVRSGRDSLALILDSAIWHIPSTPSPKRQLVWQLLYEANQGFYVLNASLAEMELYGPNGGSVLRPIVRN